MLSSYMLSKACIYIVLDKLEDSFINFHDRINVYCCNTNVMNTFFWNFIVSKINCIIV